MSSSISLQELTLTFQGVAICGADWSPKHWPADILTHHRERATHGCDSYCYLLVGQSFPSGKVVSQTAPEVNADAYAITIQGDLNYHRFAFLRIGGLFSV